MPPLSPTCPLCSRPVLAGAYSILNHGEMAHRVCPSLHPRSIDGPRAFGSSSA